MSTYGPVMADVKVSVCMITYNHERFIAQAIESVLMQETDFAVELVIGEDCSTDGTRALVVEYSQRYPDRIRSLLPDHNLGMIPNFVATMQACVGQYIALLEGDDYWTDPHKLQRQVEFLETHPEYVVCHHDAMIVDEHGCKIIDSKLPPESRCDATADELIKGAWILTLTACFRNLLDDLPYEFFKVLNGDTFLFSLLGHFGGAKYLGDLIQPAGYRVHSGGVWSQTRLHESSTFNSLHTLYWLRKYYARTTRKNYSQLYAHRVPHTKILCELPSQEQVANAITRHQMLLDQALGNWNLTPEEATLTRASLLANLYVGGAFASFTKKAWEDGGNYLKQAIDLDPEAWGGEQALMQAVTSQMISVLDLTNNWNVASIHEYVKMIHYHFSRKEDVSRTMFRKVESRLCTEAAYRRYLAGNHSDVRRFTWRALWFDPLAATDVGMLRRAFVDTKWV